MSLADETLNEISKSKAHSFPDVGFMLFIETLAIR
jgi:hypothetical protein